MGDRPLCCLTQPKRLLRLGVGLTVRPGHAVPGLVVDHGVQPVPPASPLWSSSPSPQAPGTPGSGGFRYLCPARSARSAANSQTRCAARTNTDYVPMVWRLLPPWAVVAPRAWIGPPVGEPSAYLSSTDPAVGTRSDILLPVYFPEAACTIRWSSGFSRAAWADCHTGGSPQKR